MPCTANVNMLEKVAGSIEASKGVFVIDYLGLSVKETQQLRRALREVGAEMKVYKNNIVKIALKNAGQPDIEELLAGPCAYVFYEKDPVDAAGGGGGGGGGVKKMSFIGGIADGKALSADEAKAYADLASREELMAQLVYVMASPLSGIAQVCAGPARGLVTALKAVADEKDAA